MSVFLPSLVGALPGRKVHFTTEQRNYVYSALITHPQRGGLAYEVFFQLKRAAASGLSHLDLTVVSGYSPDHTPTLRKRPDSIRFLLLATSVYRNKPIRPHRR
jgi:hypothetical protein